MPPRKSRGTSLFGSSGPVSYRKDAVRPALYRGRAMLIMFGVSVLALAGAADLLAHSLWLVLVVAAVITFRMSR